MRWLKSAWLGLALTATVHARAAAQAPGEAGDLELRLEGSYLHTSQVANGEGDPNTTDSLYVGAARTELTYALGPSTALLVQTPFLGYTRFGHAQQVSFPAVEMGARYFMAHAEDDDFAMILHSALTLRVPTVGHQRAGEIYVNTDGARSEAVTADGIFAIAPHLGLTIHAGALEIEVEAAIAMQARMVNKLWSRLEVRGPIADRWVAEAAVYSWVAQDPRPDPETGQPPLLSATGMGEFSEATLFVVTIDYALSDAYRVGGGARLPLQLVEGPVAPAVLGTLTWRGHASGPVSGTTSGRRARRR